MKMRKKDYLYPEWKMELFNIYLSEFSIKTKIDKEFGNKMVLAIEAVKDGELINNSNQIYKGVNLYKWIFQTVKRRYKNNNLSIEQIDIIENLVGKSLNKLFNNGNFVKVVDVINNKEIAICKSQCKVVKLLQETFDVNISSGVVFNRINGEVTTPYKGRFMFYYATDEEVEKYLKENKVS